MAMPRRVPAGVIHSPKLEESGRPKLTYKKLTSEFFRLFNRLVKPGQLVKAYPEEMPIDVLSEFLVLESSEVQALVMAGMDDMARAEYTVGRTRRRPGVNPFISQTIAPLNVRHRENLYEVVEKEARGWYDVVNSITKKPINEKSLRKTDAEELKNILNT